MKKHNKQRSVICILFMLMLMLLISSGAGAASVRINRKSASMKKGQKVTLKMSGTKKKVSWSSSKKKVATVSKKGVVKAVNSGKATITAKVGGKKYICKVTVKAAAATTKAPASTKVELKLDGNTTGMSGEEADVYKKMLSMKGAYPEGKDWSNDNFYEWNGGIFSGGYGCSGFAFVLSDVAFGWNDARRHTNFSGIRPGDIIRYKNNQHSVVALKITPAEVIITEGNYNKKIHWGRILTMSEIRATGTYVMTRYLS